MSKENAKENGQTKVVPYNKNDKLGTPKNAKYLLERFKGSIGEMLPKHLTAERMLKVALTAINRTPKLLECTQESVIKSVIAAAELGLDCSGTRGEAYLVPYYNNKKGKYECQLIPGYKGLVKLARQSGKIARIEAEVVHEKDHFDYVKGTAFIVNFERELHEDRGAPIGAYSLIEFKDGGQQAEYMTVDEINQIRKDAAGGNSPAWKNHWGEMAKKTVWRRLSKWAPLSYEPLERALQYSDAEFKPTYERSHIGRETGSDINEQLGLAEGEKGGETGADEPQEAEEQQVAEGYEDATAEELFPEGGRG